MIDDLYIEHILKKSTNGRPHVTVKGRTIFDVKAYLKSTYKRNEWSFVSIDTCYVIISSEAIIADVSLRFL